MEDAFALVVLTLLQLCRAEIINTEWYAANLINDPSYTPKPITEIFTTDLTFVPKNPALAQFTTQTAPPTSTTSTTSSSTRSTITIENRETTTHEQAQRIPLQIAGLPMPQQPQIITQSGNDPKSDLPSFVLIYDPRRQTSQIFQQPLVTLPPSSISQPAVTETVPPTTVTSRPSTQPTTQSSSQGMSIIPRSIQPQTIPLIPRQTSSIGTNIPEQWNIGNIIYPLPNLATTNTGCNSTSSPNTHPISSTIAPLTIQSASGKPVLTVRFKTPKGSITNIRINPTTTRRPSTTRRRKSNKRTNDYEICLHSCDGKKEPICSSPTGIFPIDSEKLKGFASLCHMACHNSFKKDQVYDKVADGRCGRLRTRIRPVDKNKLNREELHKTQYTITHNAPETVMEFSPLKR